MGADSWWICGAIALVTVTIGLSLWRASTLGARAQKASDEAATVAASKADMGAQTRMALAQASAPGDDAALDQRLQDGSF